jgi:hypothetical protein
LEVNLTGEQKKIALIAVAGGGGIILLIYLLRSGQAGVVGGTAVPAGVAESGIPYALPNNQITYNYPGIAPPPATVAPSAAPTCTQICDECADNSAYAGTASYKIPQSVIDSQYANLGRGGGGELPESTAGIY